MCKNERDATAAPVSEPRALFHYTTQTGISGIVGSSSVWATSICYMNDAREFNYARELLKDTLESTIFRDDEPFTGVVPFLKPTSWDVYPNIFVFSLSEHDDCLGLWRAYGGGATGYLLGFTTSELRSVAKKEGFKLVKCTYDLAEQRALVSGLIDRTRSWVNSLPSTSLEIFHASITQRFWDEFALLASQIKHPSFSEEGEWRMVSNGMAVPRPIDGKELSESKAMVSEPRQIQLRPGPSTLVPYVEVKLINSDGHLPLYLARVGPTIDPHRAAHSVSLLLSTSKQHVKRVLAHLSFLTAHGSSLAQYSSPN